MILDLSLYPGPLIDDNKDVSVVIEDFLFRGNIGGPVFIYSQSKSGKFIGQIRNVNFILEDIELQVELNVSNARGGGFVRIERSSWKILGEAFENDLGPLQVSWAT